jgi:hypothetical protein
LERIYEMDIQYIYSKVKEWVIQYHGTYSWWYTDFFEDEAGFEYFKEQIETDSDITADMSDDDIVDHIEEKLGQNITLSHFQQMMGEIR